MKSALAACIAVFLAGCVNHHPILSSSQTERIEREDKYLKDNALQIYASIRKVNSLGALVILPKQLSQAPHIATGSSPLQVLFDDDKLFTELSHIEERSCYFVYSEAAANSPMRMPCQTLLAEAKMLRDLKSNQDKLAAELVPTMYLVKFHTTQLEEIEKQSATVTKALSSSSAAQTKANELLKKAIEQIANSYTQLNNRLTDVVKRLEAIQ